MMIQTHVSYTDTLGHKYDIVFYRLGKNPMWVSFKCIDLNINCSRTLESLNYKNKYLDFADDVKKFCFKCVKNLIFA